MIYLTVVIVGTIRALGASIINLNIKYLHLLSMHGINLIFLIGCRLFGFFTMGHTDWGTSPRFQRVGPLIKAIQAYIWATIYLGIILILTLVYALHYHSYIVK
jgi:hypothetical protein